MIERTLAIIKPNAVANKHVGKIIDIIENHTFDILRIQKMQLTSDRARTFYAIHKEKPFFDELITFITSGPIIVMALEKENAIAEWRNTMGNTNPALAQKGTIRNLFGTNITMNTVHGSDTQETAQKELAFFFPDL
jgi:nucleoside-diphosphate kinase